VLWKVLLQVNLAERQRKDQVYTWNKLRWAHDLPKVLAGSKGLSSANEAGGVKREDSDGTGASPAG